MRLTLCQVYITFCHLVNCRFLPFPGGYAIMVPVLFYYGNTAQFPPDGLSTAPAAAARHLRCQNARQYTKYCLRFWLSICRTSLAVSALRIMRYCLISSCCQGGPPCGPSFLLRHLAVKKGPAARLAGPVRLHIKTNKTNRSVSYDSPTNCRVPPANRSGRSFPLNRRPDNPPFWWRRLRSGGAGRRNPSRR